MKCVTCAELFHFGCLMEGKKVGYKYFNQTTPNGWLRWKIKALINK